jgi:hypothetical protein
LNIADQCDYSVAPEDFILCFGGMAMSFLICPACKAKAVELAQTGMVLSMITAHEAHND